MSSLKDSFHVKGSQRLSHGMSPILIQGSLQSNQLLVIQVSAHNQGRRAYQG